MTPVRQPPATDDQMTLSVSSAGQGMVVSVGGEVDMLTSPRLRAGALEALDAQSPRTVLALDGVTFLGTSGLAVLVEIRDAAEAAGVQLRLACTSRSVLRPLTIAGLIPLFDVHESLTTALAD